MSHTLLYKGTDQALSSLARFKFSEALSGFEMFLERHLPDSFSPCENRRPCLDSLTVLESSLSHSHAGTCSEDLAGAEASHLHGPSSSV